MNSAFGAATLTFSALPLTPAGDAKVEGPANCEIRNPKQIQNAKSKCSKQTVGASGFGFAFLVFEFVSDFGFRI